MHVLKTNIYGKEFNVGKEYVMLSENMYIMFTRKEFSARTQNQYLWEGIQCREGVHNVGREHVHNVDQEGVQCTYSK